MHRRIYISSDYSEASGDRTVVEQLISWRDNKHLLIDFVDMAQVISGSIANTDNCRPCDLKNEFNQQINLSSTIIFIVGDKTKYRTAGSNCNRIQSEWEKCTCTPYKQNSKGTKICKYPYIVPSIENVGCINSYSYLEHEFRQAQKKDKHIVIIFNSLRREISWLPAYMNGYEENAQPFWKINQNGYKVGNYEYIKKELENA